MIRGEFYETLEKAEIRALLKAMVKMKTLMVNTG
jgi:hypothetical protein